MKWGVQLNGDELNLKELSKSLADDELRIYEKNGMYFLVSNKFENLTKSEEVASLAADILQTLTGAVRLSRGARIPLHVHNIARARPDGGQDIFVSLLGQTVSATTGTLGVEITRADGTTEVIYPTDKVPGWVKLGLTNQNVAKALRLFGTDEHNWVSLYRLYEVIEGDVGGLNMIVNCGWATGPSMRRFKHTANSPAAVGDVSRHGKESTSPPANPMDIGEARALIEFILHNWLRSKV